MKKIIIPFSIVTVILLAVVVILSCFILSPEENIDETPEFRLSLIENGQTEYSIVYTQSTGTEYYKDLAEYTASRFLELGANVETAGTTGDSINPKIYLGAPQGSPGISEEDINSVWVKDYLIKTSGEDIYILAGSLSAGEIAVDYLFDAYADNVNNNFILTKELNFTNTISSSSFDDGISGRISYEPVVYLVDDEYEIIFFTTHRGIAWVEIDGVNYYDEFCGVINSSKTNHRIYVPMDALDNAKKFTVHYMPVRERAAYRPVGGNVVTKEYAFRPIDMSDGLQTYVIADSHGIVDDSIKASNYFGDDTDLIILCGDIVEPRTIGDINTLMKIARGASGGIVPIVYARGNHEDRGEYANQLHEYVGTDHGKTYFTFRVANLWGIVLDYGEDKEDSHEEYGGMINFSGFREEILGFLEDVVDNADSEYNASGIDYRIAICHVPFGSSKGLDVDMFNKWRDLCSKMDLDIMISGHSHKTNFFEAGSKFKNQNYPVVVCSNGPVEDFVGVAFSISGKDALIEFVNENKKAISKNAWVLD